MMVMPANNTSGAVMIDGTGRFAMVDGSDVIYQPPGPPGGEIKRFRLHPDSTPAEIDAASAFAEIVTKYCRGQNDR